MLNLPQALTLAPPQVPHLSETASRWAPSSPIKPSTVATETELSMLNKEAYAVQQLMIQAPKGSPEKKLLKKQVRPATLVSLTQS